VLPKRSNVIVSKDSNTLKMSKIETSDLMNKQHADEKLKNAVDVDDRQLNIELKRLLAVQPHDASCIHFEIQSRSPRTSYDLVN
jgi:hypothetical protein